MPTNTADQGLTLPLQADAANEQTAMASYNTGVEGRLVKRYVDAADRTARNPTPTAGEISYLTTPGRHDFRSSTAKWMEVRDIIVSKITETQVVNNSTTLVNDDQLFVPVQSTARYLLNGYLLWDSGTTADIKFSWTGPAGLQMPIWSILAIDAAGAGPSFATALTAATVVSRGGSGIGTFVHAWLKGVVILGANAGNLQLQWAQAGLEAVNTRIKANSFLQLTRAD
jgi:hypothetical protein